MLQKSESEGEEQSRDEEEKAGVKGKKLEQE